MEEYEITYEEAVKLYGEAPDDCLTAPKTHDIEEAIEMEEE